MAERIVLSQFAVPPLDVPTGLALAQSLLAAKPKGAPAHVTEAASEIEEAATTLQDRWTTRVSAVPAEKADPRVFDRLVDTAWSALFWRLDTLASLPSDLYPRAARAAKLRDRLFPVGDRLGWLKKPYRAEWAEAKMRIDLIASEKLGKEIDDLAGPELRQEIDRSFALYGDAIGVTQPQALPPETESLLESLQDLTAAITSYSVAVLATIKRKKPESEAAARQALAPLTTARENARRGPTDAPKPMPAPTPEPA